MGVTSRAGDGVHAGGGGGVVSVAGGLEEVDVQAVGGFRRGMGEGGGNDGGRRQRAAEVGAAGQSDVGTAPERKAGEWAIVGSQPEQKAASRLVAQQAAAVCGGGGRGAGL